MGHDNVEVIYSDPEHTKELVTEDGKIKDSTSLVDEKTGKITIIINADSEGMKQKEALIGTIIEELSHGMNYNEGKDNGKGTEALAKYANDYIKEKIGEGSEEIAVKSDGKDYSGVDFGTNVGDSEKVYKGVAQAKDFVLLENPNNKYEESWMKKYGYNDVIKAKSVHDEAFNESEAMFPDVQNRWLNEADAFRHAYLSAILAKKLGDEKKAKELLWAHEEENINYSVNKSSITQFSSLAEFRESGNGQLDNNMDIYNNSVGLKIYRNNPNASEKELALLVYKALENGELAVIVKEGLKPDLKRIEKIKKIIKTEKETNRTIEIIRAGGGT